MEFYYISTDRNSQQATLVVSLHNKLKQKFKTLSLLA
jgi:hypothetical protein